MVLKISSSYTMFIFTVLVMGVWRLRLTLLEGANLASFTLVGHVGGWVLAGCKSKMVAVVVELINLTMLGIPGLVPTKHPAYPRT